MRMTSRQAPGCVAVLRPTWPIRLLLTAAWPTLWGNAVLLILAVGLLTGSEGRPVMFAVGVAAAATVCVGIQRGLSMRVEVGSNSVRVINPLRTTIFTGDCPIVVRRQSSSYLPIWSQPAIEIESAGRTVVVESSLWVLSKDRQKHWKQVLDAAARKSGGRCELADEWNRRPGGLPTWRR